MSPAAREVIIRGVIIVVLIWAEVRAMQPYNDPVLARVWQVIMKTAYTIGRWAGTVGLIAEANYYDCVKAGI